ncbi:MAG TPA: hypothetical protein VKX96_16610 [Chloroflexota bacterium]|nr:hypothetical protein [Chloroflexota bacterium]
MNHKPAQTVARPRDGLEVFSTLLGIETAARKSALELGDQGSLYLAAIDRDRIFRYSPTDRSALTGVLAVESSADEHHRGGRNRCP